MFTQSFIKPCASLRGKKKAEQLSLFLNDITDQAGAKKVMKFTVVRAYSFSLKALERKVPLTTICRQ